MVLNNEVVLSWLYIMFASSANKVNSKMLDTLQMSLRYKLNNVGQRIEPCGTPHRILSREDLVPLI